MSRSKHTRPAEILAAARVREPWEARGKSDEIRQQQIAKLLKEAGIEQEFDSSAEQMQKEPRLPRITVKKARENHHHPASKSDILQILNFFGEKYYYGLREIRLLQGTSAPSSASFVMGQLEVPGTITLFDQANSPWIVNGRISSKHKERVSEAGALIEELNGGIQSIVHWSDESLREFMLFDVLMHEIGHHLIQQYKGKRTVRVVRTSDHERFAHQFAKRCREVFLAAKETPNE